MEPRWQPVEQVQSHDVAACCGSETSSAASICLHSIARPSSLTLTTRPLLYARVFACWWGSPAKRSAANNAHVSAQVLCWGHICCKGAVGSARLQDCWSLVPTACENHEVSEAPSGCSSWAQLDNCCAHTLLCWTLVFHPARYVRAQKPSDTAH